MEVQMLSISLMQNNKNLIYNYKASNYMMILKKMPQYELKEWKCCSGSLGYIKDVNFLPYHTKDY